MGGEDDHFKSTLDSFEPKHPNKAIRSRRKRLILGGLGVLLLAGIVATVIAVVVHEVAGRQSAGTPSAPAFSTYLAPPGATGGFNGSTFFVVGDWGRLGNANQLRAAKMMADVGSAMNPQFIISVGDQFYDTGLHSADDPQFQQSFSNVYTAASLQVPWYLVLGNRDYRGGGNMYQYTDVAGTRDARWHCQNGTFSLRDLGETVGGLVDIIMIDTSPLMGAKYTKNMVASPGGIQSQNGSAVLEQLEQRLKVSTTPFKFVVGHNPVHSYGENCNGDDTGDCIAMQQLVDPVLRAGGANVYFSGHDHGLQYIQDSGTGGAGSAPAYVISGAGSDVGSINFQAAGGQAADLKYGAVDQGFVAVQVTNQQAVLYFYASAAQLPAYSLTVARN